MSPLISKDSTVEHLIVSFLHVSPSVCLCQIFGFLVCMGVILAVGDAVWEREVGSLFQSYLPWDPPVDNFLFNAFLSFWSYVIILNTVVPISLYVRWGGVRHFLEFSSPHEERSRRLFGSDSFITSGKCLELSGEGGGGGGAWQINATLVCI